MCGRFTLFSEAIEIEERFGVPIDFPLAPSYNIAPTQNVLVIIPSDDGRRADLFRWGLIPFWAKEKSIGNRMINARAETVDEKTSYKHLLRKKRCLVLSNGFYEWKKAGSKKQPYFIQLRDEPLFSFAGLWDQWEQNGEIIRSCTIITTKANAKIEKIHERMPVILDQEKENIWLDPSLSDPLFLKSILKSSPSEAIKTYPVTTMVGNPRNNSPINIEPLSLT